MRRLIDAVSDIEKQGGDPVKENPVRENNRDPDQVVTIMDMDPFFSGLPNISVTNTEKQDRSVMNKK